MAVFNEKTPSLMVVFNVEPLIFYTKKNYNGYVQ